MPSPVFPETDKHFPRKFGYQGGLVDRALPHCRGHDLAVDVGAHVGLLSRKLGQHFDRVVAFEPQFDNFRCLVENCDAEVYNIAISDTEGWVSMENPSPANSGAWECRDGGEIRCRSLDSFGFVPDLIKYDIQGFEVRALQGSRKTLLAHRPVVIVECWREGVRDNAPRYFLESIGATLVESAGKDLIFAWEESHDI